MTTMTQSARSSATVKILGSQDPSVRIVPDHYDSDGYDASEVLKATGLFPDEWQQHVLDDWMARTQDGEWASKSGGLSVPRQNGKTLITSGRIASGMVLFNEWVIYTSHLQKTSTETFEELQRIFESPALKGRVKEIRKALGREQIILKNGAKCVFVARTRSGGRGLHGDLLIFDEAQELTAEQQASFLPAISASKNPQTLYLGTPPDEKNDGGVFRVVRRNVLSHKTKKISWTEFSVDEIGDTSDRKRWRSTNPALGRRMKLSTIETEYEQMDPDTFARERLGWWAPEIEDSSEYVIEKKAWMSCISSLPKPEGKTAYGVKFSVDGSEVCLSGAVIAPDGKARITLIERRSTSEGIRWLAQWLNDRYHQASCVVIDGRNGVDLLVDHISTTWRFKGSVIKASTKTVIASVSLIINEVNEKTLTWYEGQEQLSNSICGSVKRPISGGFGFGGDNSAPAESAALALWGVRTSKRDPSRKMRIG